MKVKCTAEQRDLDFAKDYAVAALTQGKIYDCECINVYGYAYIVDDLGIETLLYAHEYEVVEDEE